MTTYHERIGMALICLFFFGAVILPRVQAGFFETQLYFESPNTVINPDVSGRQFHWPLTAFGISQGFSGYHPGMDLTDPAGTPVFAAAGGTVIYTGWDLSGYGRHVIIRHDGDIETLYAHLSKIDVRDGQDVAKSTKIGEVGATGHATGNHLHFEVHVRGTPVNPLDVLPELSKS